MVKRLELALDGRRRSAAHHLCVRLQQLPEAVINAMMRNKRAMPVMTQSPLVGAMGKGSRRILPLKT
jgi:hypothetical protein